LVLGRLADDDTASQYESLVWMANLMGPAIGQGHPDGTKWLFSEERSEFVGPRRVYFFSRNL